jgi:hypothetical protein
MSRVRKGSVGSNPTLPADAQVLADIRGVNTTELAWAAGVYDGEGSASTYLPKQRKSRARQIAVYQSGEAMPPPLLFRFRAAVGDVGLIHGPARGSLYQWHSRRHVVVDAVSELLWPWIGEVKRAQLRKAAGEVHRTVPAQGPTRWSESERAAGAAGFFDGEGTVCLAGRPRQPAVAMSIPQASDRGVPETLERFRAFVGAGSITGPRLVPSPWSKLPQYRWQLARFAEIERIVAMLYPYADVVKREQMTRCLDHVRATRASRS